MKSQHSSDRPARQVKKRKFTQFSSEEEVNNYSSDLDDKVTPEQAQLEQKKRGRKKKVHDDQFKISHKIQKKDDPTQSKLSTFTLPSSFANLITAKSE